MFNMSLSSIYSYVYLVLKAFHILPAMELTVVVGVRSINNSHLEERENVRSSIVFYDSPYLGKNTHMTVRSLCQNHVLYTTQE